MEKEQQTQTTIYKLYQLTHLFTKALQPKYYYQYRGSIHDLASEFFVQFETPKGRAKKETLLDKYDPEVTSLEYLVKVCVTRKLIDQSRQHPYKVLSIEENIEARGDSFLKELLVEEEDEVSANYIARVLELYQSLPEQDKNKHFQSVYNTESVFRDYLKPQLRYIHGLVVVQVTDKTIVLYTQDNNILNVSLETGRIRGRRNLKLFEDEELIKLRDMVGYKSNISEATLKEYLSNV